MSKMAATLVQIAPGRRFPRWAPEERGGHHRAAVAVRSPDRDGRGADRRRVARQIGEVPLGVVYREDRRRGGGPQAPKSPWRRPPRSSGGGGGGWWPGPTRDARRAPTLGSFRVTESYLNQSGESSRRKGCGSCGSSRTDHARAVHGAAPPGGQCQGAPQPRQLVGRRSRGGTRVTQAAMRSCSNRVRPRSASICAGTSKPLTRPHVETVRQAARGVRGGPARLGGELAHPHEEPLQVVGADADAPAGLAVQGLEERIGHLGAVVDDGEGLQRDDLGW